MAHSNRTKLKLSLALATLLSMQFLAGPHLELAKQKMEFSSLTPISTGTAAKAVTINSNSITPVAIPTPASTAAASPAPTATPTPAPATTAASTAPAAPSQIVLVTQVIKVCDTNRQLNGELKDGNSSYTMESDCKDCGVKTGTISMIDPAIVRDTKQLQELLIPKLEVKCTTTVTEPETDYDQRLSACAEATTKTKQRDCFLKAIKNVSFEVGSDNKPYASLSDFLAVLSGSTSPITDWIKNLINSRGPNDIKMANDSSNKILAAMNKTIDNAKSFFAKKQAITRDENQEVTDYKKEIKAELGTLKVAASYKANENGLFGRTQELAEKSADMFTKYAVLSNDSKTWMSQFIRDYEQLSLNPVYSDAQRNMIARTKIAQLASLGPAVAGEVSVLNNWVGLINEKKAIGGELKALQNDELKPVLASVSADFKTDLQKGYKEVELATQKIVLTDAQSVADANTVNTPSVVTPLSKVFELRNDPKIGLARQGNSLLYTTFPKADAIYNAGLAQMFMNANLEKSSIGVSALDGNPAAVTTPAAQGDRVFRATGMPALGTTVSDLR